MGQIPRSTERTATRAVADGRRGPWPWRPPWRGARPENNGNCIEFMIYVMILPQNH